MPNGCQVVLDYGHNPDGFQKVGEWLTRVPHRRLIGVVGVPGDRSDAVISQGAGVLSGIFDAVVVKEDVDKRGRQPGEVAGLMAERIRRDRPEVPCTIVLDEAEALRFAIQQALPGDVVVLFYESFDRVQQVVLDLGGQRKDGLQEQRPFIPSSALQ
ncbi:hypothetical protein GCM10025857_18970 [Alicyclobacillus contaminans]|nr:hypothetical protein GCM10025857_18970 [Alicyclobacillus contaminans]